MDRRKVVECESRVGQLLDVPRDGGQARRQRSTYTYREAGQRKVTRGLSNRRLGRRGPRRLPVQARRPHEAVLQHHNLQRPAPPPHQLLLALKFQQPSTAHQRCAATTHSTTKEHVPRVHGQRGPGCSCRHPWTNARLTLQPRSPQHHTSIAIRTTRTSCAHVCRPGISTNTAEWYSSTTCLLRATPSLLPWHRLRTASLSRPRI